MKNQFASAATICLLFTAIFIHQHLHAQTVDAEAVTSGTLHYGDNNTAPLLGTVVTMTVSGMIVRTSLTQTFQNNTPFWQEGTYVFPLPDDASVDTLEMKVGEAVIKGVIKTRTQARQQYESAKSEGRKASLVEQHRANLFTTHVANIPPGESIDITIEFQSAVHYDNGIFSTHFPLTITPRYLPGNRLPASQPLEESVIQTDAGWSDMSAISPPMVPTENAARTSITVNIEAGIPLQSITSNTHQIITSEIVTPGSPDNQWLVQLADSDIPMDRDFQLHWTPPLGQSPRAAVFRGDKSASDGAPEQDEGGTSTSTYASVMLIPPQQLFNGNRPSREVIFVIDTSGSMQGNSIVQARRALALGIERLTDQDTFNVIEFDNQASPLFTTVQSAHAANRTKATDWINKLHADGGTEIQGALMLALKRNQSDSTRLRQVVFVTDGSVGNEEEIFHYIRKHLDNSRLFTVGIGSAPNTWFMRKAAEAGRGSYVSIPRIEDVSTSMRNLFNKLERPVLTDIHLDILGAPAAERYPQIIPDLYAGEPITANLRWSDAVDSAEIVISGQQAGQAWSRKLALPAAGHSNNQLAKQFAGRKIEFLEDSRLFGKPSEDIEQRVTEVALEYGLVTSYTSLVAVEQKPARNPVTDDLFSSELPSAMPFGNTMPFPQGSLGLALRWIMAVIFSLLSVLFALATLQQVRSHAHG